MACVTWLAERTLKEPHARWRERNTTADAASTRKAKTVSGREEADRNSAHRKRAAHTPARPNTNRDALSVELQAQIHRKVDRLG